MAAGDQKPFRKRNGVIRNRVRFSSATVINTLGMTYGGKDYAEIREWLRRMTLTGIESGALSAAQLSFPADTYT